MRIVSELAALVLVAMPVSARAQTVPESFGPFIGDWERHGFGLTVAEDGSTEVIWRVYLWCGPGVPEPCDRVINNTRLVSGGCSEIALYGVDVDGAHGEVLWSTQPEFLAPGEVSLTLLLNGMAALRQAHQELLLCDPDFEPATEHEMDERYAGCGA